MKVGQSASPAHRVPLEKKSSSDQIRHRFDQDVERFSNLETGQSNTLDAAMVLDLISQAAAAVNPEASSVLDIGCGAGNYTLQLLNLLPDLEVTLVDLSQPMLSRAFQRINQVSSGEITATQADIRDLSLGEERYDIILAAAVFHHLRGDKEWERVFSSCYTALRPGGSLWISDLIEHSSAAVGALMWTRYGDYLADLKDAAYRDHVFAYIGQEDSPRPLVYQMNLLYQVGFRDVDVLHKNGCYAAFGAVKSFK